jgi:hypothetical protein
VIYATWPTNLLPPKDNIRIKPVSTLKQRKLQSGKFENRRFGDGAPEIADVSWDFDASNLSDFYDFYEQDCKNGAIWFTASWLSDIGYSSSYAARFFEYPRTSEEGDINEVKTKLLIQLRANIS